MSDMLSRRKLITTGLAAAAGASGLGVAAVLAERLRCRPARLWRHLWVGETLTYAAQRLLMSHHSLAREFNRSEISRVAPANGKPPENEPYQRQLAEGFQN
jgi:hypothetical protein